MATALTRGPKPPVRFGSHLSFLGLNSSESEFASARAVVVPVPYDGTTTYRAGTREGPRAILLASRELELYDEETQTEACHSGIVTVEELPVTVSSPRDMVERVRKAGAFLLEAGKLPVLLGEEHLLSLGMIEAAARHFEDLTVLHLDAHADLRSSYQGSPYSNACVMHQALRHASLVQVGVRSMTREEHQLITANNIPCFLAHQLWRDAHLWEEIVPHLGAHVYISIDLDVFDPALMPAVGTPEPGGPGWYEVIGMLRRVIGARRVVGFDVMELLPQVQSGAAEFLAARLVYKLLSYIFLDRKC
jgi:agmatinase